MDVTNSKLEAASVAFKQNFSCFLSKGYIEMTYSVINVAEKWVLTLPSDYHWHLQYWGYGLDLKLNERCRRGVRSWCEYSDIYQKTLAKKSNNIVKTDICIELPTGYEIFSVSRTQDTFFQPFIYMPKLKAIVSDYVYRQKKIWRDNLLLPLRSKIVLDGSEKNNNYFFPESRCLFFNGVRLTQMEMDTIKLLLMLKSIKEIANIHNCSMTAEKNRIKSIKKKVNCENKPLSSMFLSLKEKGIIEACMDFYVP